MSQGKRPIRGPGAKADLSGPEVGVALQSMGVDINHFARFAGANASRVRRYINGSDPENPPRYFEHVLFILEHFPKYRTSEMEFLDLPLEKWGLDPEHYA